VLVASINVFVPKATNRKSSRTNEPPWNGPLYRSVPCGDIFASKVLFGHQRGINRRTKHSFISSNNLATTCKHPTRLSNILDTRLKKDRCGFWGASSLPNPTPLAIGMHGPLSPAIHHLSSFKSKWLNRAPRSEKHLDPTFLLMDAEAMDFPADNSIASCGPFESPSPTINPAPKFLGALAVCRAKTLKKPNGPLLLPSDRTWFKKDHLTSFRQDAAEFIHRSQSKRVCFVGVTNHGRLYQQYFHSESCHIRHQPKSQQEIFRHDWEILTLETHSKTKFSFWIFRGQKLGFPD